MHYAKKFLLILNKFIEARKIIALFLAQIISEKYRHALRELFFFIRI